jgi:hypothetical protein
MLSHIFRRRRRYDPWPDLLAAYERITRELMERAKTGDLSPAAYRMAQQGVRSTYDNFVIYATCGRDRKKLGPDWAQKAEENMRQSIRWAEVFSG